MLAKCMLANPAAGHHLCWREILRLVRSCIQRWLAGDLVALWSEAVAEGHPVGLHTNAFNNISHEAMFVEFRRHLPNLSAWIQLLLVPTPPSPG